MVPLWIAIQVDVLNSAKKGEMSNLNNVYILMLFQWNNFSGFLNRPSSQIKNTTLTVLRIKKIILFASVAIMSNFD